MRRWPNRKRWIRFFTDSTKRGNDAKKKTDSELAYEDALKRGAEFVWIVVYKQCLHEMDVNA